VLSVGVRIQGLGCVEANNDTSVGVRIQGLGCVEANNDTTPLCPLPPSLTSQVALVLTQTLTPKPYTLNP